MSCPHCERHLADPPSKKLSDEDIATGVMESLERLDEFCRSEAEAKRPADRTFSDWTWIVGFSQMATGAELLDQVTKVRDEVADSVR